MYFYSNQNEKGAMKIVKKEQKDRRAKKQKGCRISGT